MAFISTSVGVFYSVRRLLRRRLRFSSRPPQQSRRRPARTFPCASTPPAHAHTDYQEAMENCTDWAQPSKQATNPGKPTAPSIVRDLFPVTVRSHAELVEWKSGEFFLDSCVRDYSWPCVGSDLVTASVSWSWCWSVCGEIVVWPIEIKAYKHILCKREPDSKFRSDTVSFQHEELYVVWLLRLACQWMHDRSNGTRVFFALGEFHFTTVNISRGTLAGCKTV